jgi:hypothetical protein
MKFQRAEREIVIHPSPKSLSDLSRPAAKNGLLAQISPRFRPFCSHKLLKLMKILTRIPLSSLECSKSDRLRGVIAL